MISFPRGEAVAEDNFWNLLLTEPGLELIASQFCVGCGCSLFYLGMAGWGVTVVWVFMSALNFTGRSPPSGPTQPLIVMFLFVIFFLSFSYRLFNLAILQKWNAICIHKQSNISKWSLLPQEGTVS